MAVISEINLESLKLSGATAITATAYASGINTSDYSNSATYSTPDFSYTYDPIGKYYICSGMGNVTWTDLTIPYTYNDGSNGEHDVKKIADRAFYMQDEITSITIPATVTEIGASAFEDCTELGQVIFAENSQLVSIGNSAFYNTGMPRISIPASVTSIGTSAFSNAGLSNGITFEENSMLKTVGRSAFEYTLFTSINLPDGLTVISDDMFKGNSRLNSVNIPGSVTSIGAHAFQGTSITAINIPDSVTSISTGAFESCNSLTTMTVGTGVTEIPDDMCKSSTKLSNLFLNGRINKIKSYAFYGTSLGSTFTIPTTVTEIDQYAFAGTQISNIDIPDSVTFLGEGAFHSVTNINRITFGAGLTYIPDYAFASCKLSPTAEELFITLGSGTNNIDYIGNYAFYKFGGADEIVIGEKVAHIYPNAFLEASVGAIYFSNTSGWFYTDYSRPEGGSYFNKETLADSEANVEYFTNTYARYRWYKLKTLPAPTIAYKEGSSHIMTITDSSGLAEKFYVYVGPDGGRVLKATITINPDGDDIIDTH